MKSFRIIPFQFPFKRPSGTSRGVMTLKKSWFIALTDENDFTGWGECSIIEGLSPDYVSDEEYCSIIFQFCQLWQSNQLINEQLTSFPSILFGFETALQDLKTGGKQVLFESDFVQGKESIPINGLVWMGTTAFMKEQIRQKLDEGFTCIKMKIGAIDWKEEHAILSELRKEYSSSDVELRVDANGAFSPKQAVKVLEQLAHLEVHSIEQPIKPGQIQEMSALCEATPCPIALDEELIGKHTNEEKKELLNRIRPQYIILKPSLVGGFSGMLDWTKEADQLSIPWWATSALESNIGLNAIAQYTATFNNPLPQGLGTGSLYTKNIPSPLCIIDGALYYEPTKRIEADRFFQGKN